MLKWTLVNYDITLENERTNRKTSYKFWDDAERQAFLNQNSEYKEIGSERFGYIKDAKFFVGKELVWTKIWY